MSIPISLITSAIRFQECNDCWPSVAKILQQIANTNVNVKQIVLS